MSEPITIEDVKRLDVHPGDVLLVTLPHAMNAQMADAARAQFAAALPGVKVILKAPDIAVEVVSAEHQIADAVAEATANPGKIVEAGGQG